MGFRQKLGYVPEEPHLYTHLSGMEYLVMVGQLRDLPAKAARERIDGLLRLFALLRRPARSDLFLLEGHAAEGAAVGGAAAQSRSGAAGRAVSRGSMWVRRWCCAA